MPPPKRRQPLGVIARLLAEPHRFSFFQAVRLLDRWFGARDRSRPSAPLSPRLHFRNTLSLSFPASEIAEFKPHLAEPVVSPSGMSEANAVTSSAPEASTASALEAVDRVEITPAFMSLLGAGGTLPTFYTELLAEREIYHRDTAARAFLDIFQHRAVTLFYEAWRKHRLPIRFEADQREEFLPLVLAIAGLGQDTLRDRMRGAEAGVPDITVAHFAGLIQRRPMSALAIQQIVGAYFAVDARIEQFVGRWFTLPADSRSHLGEMNAMLGANAVVGERVWQRDLRMRLTLGPMTRRSLRRFLPGGPGALALRELLTLLTGVGLEYEIRLALGAAEVRGIALEPGEGGAQLGWDSFLISDSSERDRADPGYELHALH